MKNFYKKNIKNKRNNKNLDNFIEKDIQNNFDIKHSPIVIGFEHGLYFTGFGQGLASLNLSEASIAEIIATKMNLEYQQEIARMKFETDEKIAELYSTAAIQEYED